MGLFQVADYVLYQHNQDNENLNNYHEAKKVINSLSDEIQSLNDSVLQNYCTSANYFDDNCDKTAFYLDFASMQDTHRRFIAKTQDYSMMTFSSFPSLAFKLACAREKK